MRPLKRKPGESDVDYAARTEKAREADRARQRKYYAAHKEAQRERCRKYHQDNKGTIKTRQREYYEVNKERLQQYGREYIAANKEAIKEYKQSPQGRAADARRKVKRKRQLNAYTLSPEQKHRIDEIRMNCPDGMHVDHKWPLCKGGIDHPLNLTYLSAEENLAKSGGLHRNMLPPIELAPGCFIEMPDLLL